MPRRKKLFRKVITRAHQHCGPINPVKFDNIFPNHMQIRWPKIAKFVRNRWHIAIKRIKPNVCYLFWIKRKRNSKFICFTRNRKIFKPTFYEFNHLIVTSSRRDPIRIFLVQFEQFILIFWKSEKIIFFTNVLNFFIWMIWTMAIH